jgi:hypothetical protein
MRPTSLFANVAKTTPRQARLGLERLEMREVPAAVTATLSNGLLTINGTSQADIIRVNQVNNRISVQGVKIQSGSSQNADVSAASVTKIVVNGHGGNDLIDLNSNTWANSQLLQVKAEVYGGTGDDTVHGTAAGDRIDGGDDNDKMYGYGGDDTIYGRVGRDRIAGGKGNDTIVATLRFDSLQIAKSGRLFHDDSFAAGDGTDKVRVDLDLGTFASKLLNPALREMKAATSVFSPVLNLLNRKVPVLSKFDASLTYRKVAEAYSPKLKQFLNSLDTVKRLSSGVSMSGTVTLGEFEVAAGSKPTIRTTAATSVAKINNSALSAARSAGVRFGLLEDPQSAVRMMMGHNVDLASMSLSLPRFEAGLSKTYSAPTGIPGLNAEVDFGGKVFASAKATFGVDMSGVWKGSLIKGFFVSNASATVGAEATVKGGVAVGVPNVIRVASIKGYGTVGGSINFAMRGGSKVYFDQLANYYSDNFKTSGQLSYDIGIEVKYSKYKWTKTWWGGYPEWVGATHRESFGRGTFKV